MGTDWKTGCSNAPPMIRYYHPASGIQRVGEATLRPHGSTTAPRPAFWTLRPLPRWQTCRQTRSRDAAHSHDKIKAEISTGAMPKSLAYRRPLPEFNQSATAPAPETAPELLEAMLKRGPSQQPVSISSEINSL